MSLIVGQRVVLVADLTPVDVSTQGKAARIGCTLPEAVGALKQGQHVLFDDGKIAAVVEAVKASEATLRVVRTKPSGQNLGAQKGINLPDTTLAVTALTADDEAHLAFVAAHADIVSVSFIRTASDVSHLFDCLDAADTQNLAVGLKIETRQGFENPRHPAHRHAPSARRGHDRPG